jgi:RNA polymerase sigma factor (sigma-70 family)
VAYRQDADKRWVGKLYQRYAHLVLGLCYKYLGSRAMAEDATCDVFLSLYDKLKRHDVEHFKSWLYTTAKHHCLIELRKQKPKRHTELNGHEVADTGEELQFKRLEESQYELLSEGIEQLPAAQAQCLKLFYLERKSYTQVDEMTGLGIKAVKSHIQNGKRKLRIILEKHDVFR